MQHPVDVSLHAILFFFFDVSSHAFDLILDGFIVSLHACGVSGGINSDEYGMLQCVDFRYVNPALKPR